MPRNTIKKRFSLKDHLFNRERVQYLGALFARKDPKFDTEKFVADVMKQLTKLELKERIIFIAEVLEQHLPKDFTKAAKLIVKALPKPLDPSKTDNDFGSFIFAPIGEYVVRNGLKKELLKTSYATLLELTLRFSMEDAMRPFLNEFEKETLVHLSKWVRHNNYHARRLVSESTRPLLPWSRRIQLDMQKPIKFLDVLHADNTRYVTRSVANHLNDVAKKDPSLVVETLKRWKIKGKQKQSELDWMTKHALRTLIKQGNTDALLLLGYGSNAQVRVEQFAVEGPLQKIAEKGLLTFSFDLIALKDEELLIDYSIDFVKAKGHTRPKVFKIKKLSMAKGQRVTITKKHALIADATTFTLHKGVHTITLQINGRKLNSAEFIIH